MKKSRFTEEQIIGFLSQAEAGMSVMELCRQGGFSDATFYRWRAKHGGMRATDAKRLRELESESAKLKRRRPLQAGLAIPPSAIQKPNFAAPPAYEARNTALSFSKSACEASLPAAGKLTVGKTSTIIAGRHQRNHPHML